MRNKLQNEVGGWRSEESKTDMVERRRKQRIERRLAQVWMPCIEKRREVQLQRNTCIKCFPVDTHLCVVLCNFSPFFPLFFLSWKNVRNAESSKLLSSCYYPRELYQRARFLVRKTTCRQICESLLLPLTSNFICQFFAPLLPRGNWRETDLTGSIYRCLLSLKIIFEHSHDRWDFKCK